MTALSAMKKGAEAISNSVNGTAEQKAKKVKKLEKKYKKDLKREPKKRKERKQSKPKKPRTRVAVIPNIKVKEKIPAHLAHKAPK